MRNLKAFSLLLVAVLLGLAAAVYASAWIGQHAHIAANKVVVATVDIPAGGRLAPEMLATLDWPSGALPAGAITDVALLKERVMRTGVEELISFSTMLTQADKFGTSIGESLRVFSEDLRHKRQMRAEEHAAKVPTKMLFPLVLFIFPSIIMVVLGPAIIQVVRTVGPILAGTN